MSLRAYEGWEQVMTLTGAEEWGATYRGHYLDVSYLGDDWWAWSATHRYYEHARGMYGHAKTRAGAQSAAQTAVDRWRCADPLTPEEAA